MSFFELFVALVVLALLVWAVRMLAPLFPEPVATVLYVGIVVLLVLWFLRQLGGTAFIPLDR